MLQEALLAALGGNKERAAKRLIDLEQDELQVADGDLELLKAIIAMTENDFPRVIEHANESMKKESSILGKDRVGARAIKAVANYWITDSIGLIELEARELQKFEPDTDMDKLLLAYATIGHAPERTKESIDTLESSYRRTPVGLLIRAQCRNSIAADRRDVAGLISASQELRTASFLLDDSELARTWELSALTCAIEIASQNGNIEDTTDWINRGKKIADELTRNNLNAWHRWKFYSAAGFASEAEAACRERTQRDCFFIASECLMNLGLDDVKAKFDELTNHEDPDSPFAQLVRAHILANQVDAKQKIVDSVSRLLQAPGPITRRHALAVLCLVCSADEVRDFALSSNRSNTFESLDDIWKGELMVSYYAGELDRDELLARCGDHAWTLSNAHYTIATLLLAEGKRDEAIEHFKQGVLHGNGTSIDYTLCKAYWKRLEGDDRWLASE
jgi:hypothetical protein